MQVHKLIFILLLAGGLSTSFVMLPRKQELALMYLQEGKLAEAETLYEDMYRENQLNRVNLVPLTQVYLAQGHVGKAIRVYEIYLKRNPNDIKVLEQLAALYRDTQRFYDYASLLEKIVANKPTRASLDALAKLYALFGAEEKLIPTLKQLVELDPARLKEYQRLVRLQAAAGDYVGAEHTLAQYILNGNQMTRSLAELRLRLFLSAGRTDEAFEWAKHWLDRDQDIALRFTAVLYSAGTSSGVNRAFESDSAIDPNDMPRWLVRAIVQTGWTENKAKFLDHFTSRLREEKKRDFPVIMAKLALSRNDNEALNGWLEIAEQSPDLDAGQKVVLAEIYLASNRTDLALQLLAELADDPKTPVSLFTNAAVAILKAGEKERGLALYQRLKNQRSDSQIDYAWALLASASGKEEVQTWLESEHGKQMTYLQLTDLYYVAADRGYYPLALNIARQIYARFDGPDELNLLAESLIKAEKASEALVLLRPYKTQSSQLSGLYEQALSEAWKADPGVRKEVVALWKQRLKSSGLSRKARRGLAFQLLRIGEKQTAAKEFQRLAKAEGPNGKSVRQLLFVWGPLPGGDALDWLEGRARRASTPHLAGWWRHLIQAGGGDRVLSMVANISVKLSPEAEGVLMNALTAAGDTSGLDQQLREQADKTAVPSRLETLAAQANRDGLFEAQEYILQRLIKFKPDNATANRGLGMAAFYRGDRKASEIYLKRYLDGSKGDWESIFYLAEVMYADGKHKKAQPYFERSLVQIDADAKPVKRQRIARALMFYRLGRTQAAMNEYDKLLKAYPNDVELRADYSALLIDEGQLDKARLLLGEK